MSQKTINIILLVALGAAIIIGIIALISANKKTTTPVVTPINTAQAGLGGALGAIIAEVFTGGWIQNLLGGNKCDPKNPGFTKSGIRDLKCGTPDELKCDPNKPGYNKAGLPDIECGFGG